jgi:hypothetical protein
LNSTILFITFAISVLSDSQYLLCTILHKVSHFKTVYFSSGTSAGVPVHCPSGTSAGVSAHCPSGTSAGVSAHSTSRTLAGVSAHSTSRTLAGVSAHCPSVTLAGVSAHCFTEPTSAKRAPNLGFLVTLGTIGLLYHHSIVILFLLNIKIHIQLNHSFNFLSNFCIFFLINCKNF